MKRIFSILFLLSFTVYSFAQNDSLHISQKENTKKDTTSVIFTHSAKKATWMSFALPGLGQAYNKKYWKIPIIYGLLGTFGYFAQKNHKEYVFYRDAYKDRIDDVTSQDPNSTVYAELLSDEELKTEMKRWERNRNLNYIGLFLTYIANIVDASVDANLFYYDISDDLSLRFDPMLINTSNTTSAFGVKCRISF